MLCYLQALTSLSLLLPCQGPLQAITPQDTWSLGSRVNTDLCKTPHIFCGPCIFNFTMPTYSGCHPHDVLLLIYTRASYNHIVNTARTSRSVKGQYATNSTLKCFAWNLTHLSLGPFNFSKKPAKFWGDYHQLPCHILLNLVHSL